jgi:pyrroline-5-carboxylate reductase
MGTRLGLIGGGLMGEAIVSAVLKKGVLSPADIVVSDIRPERRDLMARKYGLAITEDNARVAAESDIALLAVKPQEFGGVAKVIQGHLNSRQTVVSIMAGVRIERLCSTLNHPMVIRVMPNTPAMVGEGMSLWTATDDVSEEARENVRTLLAALGRELYMSDEKYLDMATAVSASSPAFIFLVMEALTDAGVHIGLRRDLAIEMVTQTVLGTARLAQETGTPFSELRHMVTSPAGTTAEGLRVLENARVRAAIIEAIIATYEKGKTLGG